MPQYLSPGVYVEEVEAGSRPIEGVATSVAAFVGLAKNGPVNAPTLVTNWTQYVQTFGDFMDGSYLAHAVYGYFNNGGGSAYIVRVGANGNGDGSDASQLVPARAELPSAGDAESRIRVVGEVGGGAGNGSLSRHDASEGGEEGERSAHRQAWRPGVESFDTCHVTRPHNVAICNATRS